VPLTVQDAEKDLYAVLGVPASATEAEIKKAYRALARRLHPDKNPGDAKAEARFKDVSAAYDVVGDAAQRKEYDELRRLLSTGGAPRPGGGGGAPGGSPFGGGAGGDGGFAGGDIGDLLGGLFGRGGARGRRTPRGPLRGDDVSARLTVDLRQAMTGVEASVRLPDAAACPTCQGSGAAPGTAPHACAVCGGAGVTSRNQGGFAFSEPCRACGGTGQIVDTPCPTCGGRGTRDRVQKVRIPAGVRDGQALRVRGKGAPGQRGGPSGDLQVEVSVTPDPVFGREGDQLTVRVPVSYPEAALGATVTVPTLDGPVTLKVPAGSTPGKRLRVRGRGFPTRGAGRGDLLVTLDLSVPSTLTPAARTLLEQLATEAPEDPRAALLAAAAAGVRS